MELALQGLGDTRLDDIFTRLVRRASDCGRLVVRQLACGRWEEVKFGRFLNNPRFSFMDMIDSAVKLMAPACAGRHVLLIEDTSEVSFGRAPFQQGLAKVGNGAERGFYLHPVIAMDADDHLCLGLAALEVFKRQEHAQYRNKAAFEQKQSFRWLSSARAARRHCATARAHTVVTDREGDIYEALCGYVGAGLDFVVRCWHNRLLAEGGELWALVESWPLAGVYECPLPPTDQRSAHKAGLQIRYGAANIARPTRGTLKHLPPLLAIHVLEVRESAETVVNNEQPVHWLLLTSHPADNLQTARQLALYYTKRWNIEQVFRVLKSQGLQLQDAPQHTFDSLAKLSVVGLLAAVRVLQLVSARNNADAPIGMAFDEQQAKVIESIAPTLEGKTDRQKNPHPPKTLAFAAWVVARLGGWKGYAKNERPPGPITMWIGLQKLQTYLQAYAIFSYPNDT